MLSPFRLPGAVLLAVLSVGPGHVQAQTSNPIPQTSPDARALPPADVPATPTPLPPAARPDTPGGTTSNGVARPPAMDPGIEKATPSASGFPMPVIRPPGTASPGLTSPDTTSPGAGAGTTPPATPNGVPVVPK